MNQDDEADRIMAMNDEEIFDHVRAQGKDPHEVAATMRAQIDELLAIAEREHAAWAAKYLREHRTVTTFGKVATSARSTEVAGIICELEQLANATGACSVCKGSGFSPHRMDAREGPTCACGKPSTKQSGACDDPHGPIPCRQCGEQPAGSVPVKEWAKSDARPRDSECCPRCGLVGGHTICSALEPSDVTILAVLRQRAERGDPLAAAALSLDQMILEGVDSSKSDAQPAAPAEEWETVEVLEGYARGGPGVVLTRPQSELPMILLVGERWTRLPDARVLVERRKR